MRKTIACVVGVVVGSSAAMLACVSSSNPLGPAADASFDLDAAGFDAAGFDVSAFDVAAPIDVTTNPADTSPPVDGGAPPADATVPIDSASPDDASVKDAGPVDAGNGSVTSVTGLQLGTTRQGHSSTLLADGRVLICGGYYGTSASSATCDLFDPTTTTISAGPSMIVPRQNHGATRLANGQVLIAGGTGPTNDAGGYNALPSAEIFDPTQNKFTLVAGHLVEARSTPAVLIGSGANAGKVVLAGGYGDGTIDSGTPNDTSLGTAEVFSPGTDPATGTFSLVPASMSQRRGNLVLAPLPGGGVLAAGGSYGPGGGPYAYPATADVLDPTLTSFSADGGSMSMGRQSGGSVVMADGRVFIMGGESGTTAVATTADIYDPATGNFTTVTLPAKRTYMALALLKSGRVLIAGGSGPSYATLGDVLLYDPATNAFLTTNGTLNPPRALATATTLNDGRVVIAGGQTAQGFVTTAVDIFTE